MFRGHVVVNEADPLLDSLDVSQAAAVTSRERRLRVIAGPGSGKTRVLTSRAARLVATGADPRRVLCVTFTNKAAKEMRRRLDQQLGAKGGGIWTCTFHGLSLRLLRRFGRPAGVAPDFGVYGEGESHALMASVVAAILSPPLKAPIDKVPSEGLWPYDGWRVIGTLQHGPRSTVVLPAPDVKPDEIPGAPPWCDWCRREGMRHRTVILSRGSQTRQLEEDCLDAALGGANAELVRRFVAATETMMAIAIADGKQKLKEPKRRDHAIRAFLERLDKDRSVYPDPEAVKPAEKRDVYDRVAAAYEKALAARNALDFGALLCRAVDACAAEGSGPALASLFDHVLVDEYQDVNRPQARIALHLASQGTLAAVGDDDQSIYGWRGANPAEIVAALGGAPVELGRNYRSTPTIVAAAAALMGTKTVRRDVAEAVRRPPTVEPLRLRHEKDAEGEARFVAATVVERVRDGASPADFAVIYRTKEQARVLEDAMRAWDVPYRVFGGISFYERREVRNLTAYLRLLASDDEGAVRRVANVPPRRLGRVAMIELDAYARRTSQGMLSAMRGAANDTLFGPIRPAVGKAAKGFADLIDGLRREAEKKPLGDLVELVLQRTGYRKLLEEEAAQEGDVIRLENVGELVDDARRHVVTAEGGASISSFLEKLALVSSERAGARSRGPCVSLMTAHRTKGLEFPVVFVTGLELGLMPHHQGDADEERRLCYVAATRARDALYLTWASARFLGGTWRVGARSPFVDEIVVAMPASAVMDLSRPMVEEWKKTSQN